MLVPADVKALPTLDCVFAPLLGAQGANSPAMTCFPKVVAAVVPAAFNAACAAAHVPPAL
jgi:peroxiredoxin